ncbi:acyl carrier protein [Luteolibacter sp. SL250]|uniref:acyl carrier protein n=1 Tax=Luteolibacter sp. SL250 TaxID=2995170 RepID=UPI00226EDAA4|nr:acyl carrier protein [Luteolibacter sp. SL250]WAC18678.1 acyl carrier protein [Luteolibacter sp. SL250]
MSPEEVIDWLNEEGMVELGDGFPADGDLFSAGLDSMAVMQMVVAAEEKFGVILGPGDMTRANLSTPRSLAALISSKTSP